MNAARSLRPRSESAASCSPAGQPSVRSCSSSTSAASRPSASEPLSSASASPSAKRSSLRAELDQLAGRAQAGERQRRVGAGGERELHRPRQVAEQEGQRRVHELVAQQVVVVEHEHDRLGQRRELVDQPRQDDLDQRRPGVGQRGQHRSAEARGRRSAARRSRSSRSGPGRRRPGRARPTRTASRSAACHWRAARTCPSRRARRPAPAG